MLVFGGRTMPQKTNLNVSPYFEDFDDNKNFYKILFRPGYSIQSRELTQLQSILQNQIESYGKYAFKQGDLVIPGEVGLNNKLDYVKLSSVSEVAVNDGDDNIVYKKYDIEQLIGTQLRGLTSGVIGNVVSTQNATETNADTLFVIYTTSGNANNESTFRQGETLEVIDGINTPLMVVGTDGFVAKSTDGGNTWANIMRKGVGVRENYKLGLSQSDNSVSMSGSQDNGSSILNTEGWLEFFGADGMEAIIHPLNPNWMIASVQYGFRVRTKNGGLTHDFVTLPNNNEDGDWESPILYDPNNPMTVYDFSLGVDRSDNFGSSYVHVGDPLFDHPIKHAEIAQNNSQILLVARHSSIEKSIDGGANFVSIKNNLPNASIQDIAFDPKDDNTFFVVYASYQNNGNKDLLT